MLRVYIPGDAAVYRNYARAVPGQCPALPMIR